MVIIMIIFRKATDNDTDAIANIYMDVHTMEEAGVTATGWKRGIYPVRDTVISSLKRDDMFVLEDDEGVCACGIINKIQVDVYEDAEWENDVPDDEITVLHTLAISPKVWGRGYGKLFVKYYEEYATKTNSPYLRMDTNETNLRARAMYKKLGYKEIGTVPCVFNGIDGINLVLLEKKVK